MYRCWLNYSIQASDELSIVSQKIARANKGDDVNNLKVQRGNIEKQIQAQKVMLVVKLTTGIYKEPRDAFIKKLAEHSDLCTELKKMTGKQFPTY